MSIRKAKRNLLRWRRYTRRYYPCRGIDPHGYIRAQMRYALSANPSSFVDAPRPE